MAKLFSRHEVDLKWVWLVEPPFENPGYGPEMADEILSIHQTQWEFL